jgi:methylated-DNA-protein-cysteine methyltransferase-like protein
MQPFTRKVVEIIKCIPPGRVLTYGRIAALAGNPGAARQVSRFLHSMSEKHDLPWHRVINAKGEISLKRGQGYELQKALLESEGVRFTLQSRVDMATCLWAPAKNAGG